MNRRTLSDERRVEIKWMLPLAVMILTLYAVSVFATRALGYADPNMLGDYAHKALFASPLILISGLTVILIRLALAGERQPIARFSVMLKRQFPDGAAICSRVLLIILMPLLFCSYSTLKMLIPSVVAFDADALFARADRLLFLGTDPWRVTHAMFGNEATFLIDRLYTLWVPLLAFSIGYFTFFARHEDRARFFLTFSGAWILLGTIGAYLGASAGPCFLGLMGNPESAAYAELMNRLWTMEAELGGRPGDPALGALHWQNVLWEAYNEKAVSFGMGISAMPSMHVSVATLYVLSARRLGRIPLALASLFFAVTIVGSVHLGWHYAVDGLVSGTATVAIWRAVGRYLTSIGFANAKTIESAPRPQPA